MNDDYAWIEFQFPTGIYYIQFNNLEFYLTYKEWRTQVLGKVDSPQIALLNKVEEKILKKYTDIWIPCDQLIAAAVVEPKVKSIHTSCIVTLCTHFYNSFLMTYG